MATNGNGRADLTFTDEPVLHRVARAVARKERADREYKAALQAARDAGYSGAQIAGPARVSRQAVLQLTVPPRELPPPLDAGAEPWQKIARLRQEVGYD